MRKILMIIISLYSINVFSQKENKSFFNTNYSLENNIKINQNQIKELEFQIRLLETKIDSLKDSNSQQIDFYKENQTTIFWMVSVFIGMLGGAFVLFTYLFKRPDEILKKIKESENQSKEIITEANLLLRRIDFQYEHQESIFILNKKSLFNYTDNDWNLVQVYANKAEEIKPDKRTANDWIFIGLYSFKKIKIKDAIFAFEKATEINPSYEIAWKHLGNSYDKNDEFEKAINAFNKVIEINPNNDIAFNNLGIEYIAIGKFKEAERNFLTAIRLNPNNCYAYTNYFELCLVNEIPFKKELVKVFEEKFINNLNAMASFDMLNIYNKISNNEKIQLDTVLETWKNKYNSVGWDESYREVENWIEKKEGETKLKLMTALNVFSSDSAFKNYA